jgi:hypothetical protein
MVRRLKQKTVQPPTVLERVLFFASSNLPALVVLSLGVFVLALYFINR